jgi:hypothetical protein
VRAVDSSGEQYLEVVGQAAVGDVINGLENEGLRSSPGPPSVFETATGDAVLTRP